MIKNDPAVVIPTNHITITERDTSGEAVGLTKKEWFAGMAMQGIISNPETLAALATAGIETQFIQRVTKLACEHADAILEELQSAKCQPQTEQPEQ